ncbi:MAG: RNase adapter RapZ [Candidatus Dormiibacterota bacterium]
MTDAAVPGASTRLLVFGPPGAGAALVAAGMARQGMTAVSWEGGQEESRPAVEAADLTPGEGPVLLALDASDLACLTRSMAPWAARELAQDLTLATRELEESRERLFPARLRANAVLDTTHVNAQELLARASQIAPFLREQGLAQPAVVIESFAYPRGVPLDLSSCFDTRAIRNPYWEPSLRMLTGLDPRVQEFVLEQRVAEMLLSTAMDLVDAQLPALRSNSRQRLLRLAFGCSGGFHRSVALTEEFGRRLQALGVSALIWHRDLPQRA